MTCYVLVSLLSVQQMQKHNIDHTFNSQKTPYRSPFEDKILDAFCEYFGENWPCYNMLWLGHGVPCILLMCVPIGWQQVISWRLAWFIGSASLPWVCYITLDSFTVSLHSPRYYICCIRADSTFGPSQWEMALLCNDDSHWLGASLESALLYEMEISHFICIILKVMFVICF